MPPETATGPRPRVTGSVRIDLNGTRHQVRCRAFQLERLWPGTHVQLDVGNTCPGDAAALDLVGVIAHATYQRGLAIDVLGEPDAVQRWVHDLRDALAAHRHRGSRGGGGAA